MMQSVSITTNDTSLNPAPVEVHLIQLF